jgi:S1-C subfamily serine protease
MKNFKWLIGGGLAALGLALVALPSLTAASQEPADSAGCLEQRVQELHARIQEKLAGQAERISRLAQARAQEAAGFALVQSEVPQQQPERQRVPGGDMTVVLGDEGASWLGVEMEEVTPDAVKQLKLPAERGVVLERIVPDSPAAKAGLKDNDVVTEVNGQRVEGAAEFRRMIREIPAGRTAQLTIWRDGRAQTISVTLGKSEQRRPEWFGTNPGTFAFRMPETRILRNLPDMDWGFDMLPNSRPRLGIDVEDLGSQLGAYFGVPDGEGVLVRGVNPGSPAEKAGVKAGDVITSIDGARIRSVDDLREKLAEKHDDKTTKLGILRNKSETSVTVELPAPAPKSTRKVIHFTDI